VIAVGLGAGLICSLVAASLIRNLLFDTVPWTFRRSLAWAAARRFSIPGELRSARRTASVNPITALRAE